MQTTFFTLAPSAPAPADAKATVAWQPGRQSGVIRISNLPAPQPGKDYQLWAVDAAHTDPISAGVIRVDKNGVAQVRFKPVDRAEHVKAFAISLEREGGVPKKEGPILLVGTA
jgi:anti-sigma-K factor RskA